MIQPASFRWLTKYLAVALALMFCAVLPAYSAGLKLVYEQVVRDSWGNEIGYRSVSFSNPSDLPAGSAWRNYLNLKLADGRTIYEYARDTSQQLAKPMTLTLSDRNSNSYTSKNSSGYNLNLYNYINSFSADSSKTFLFLHEFGHVAMLNAYPSTYNFSGLDYGNDGKHYLDEILPNDNTAWVEGWGNAFAASRNNGMVFSFNLNNISSLAFLQNNSFNEMSRNELFVAKTLYDSFSKISSGREKTFNVISRTGPHYSLRDFCRKYVALYPNDKVGLAKILFDNSQGRMTLNELLDYVNGGSRTVSRDFYTYLTQAGLVVATSGNTAQPANPTGYTGSTNTTTSTSTTSTSIWGRLSSWFGRIFNFGAQSPIVPSPAASIEPSVATGGAVAPLPENAATAPEMPGTAAGEFDSINDLGRAQELYYQCFAEYNRLMAASNSDKQQVLAAQKRMLQAKERVKVLRRGLK